MKNTIVTVYIDSFMFRTKVEVKLPYRIFEEAGQPIHESDLPMDGTPPDVKIIIKSNRKRLLKELPELLRDQLKAILQKHDTFNGYPIVDNLPNGC